MFIHMLLRNFTFDRIDGSIRAEDRQRAIRRFTTSNTEECFVLLLSTRAAGLGLNLQAANTVILFDSDPNPQADAQAMARTHRIGQQRKVHVYRLISRATYEEALLKRASLKLGLGEAVLSAGEGFAGVKVVDLAESENDGGEEPDFIVPDERGLSEAVQEQLRRWRSVVSQAKATGVSSVDEAELRKCLNDLPASTLDSIFSGLSLTRPSITTAVKVPKWPPNETTLLIDGLTKLIQNLRADHKLPAQETMKDVPMKGLGPVTKKALTPREVERLLREGAHAVFNETSEEANLRLKRFEEEDLKRIVNTLMKARGEEADTHKEEADKEPLARPAEPSSRVSAGSGAEGDHPMEEDKEDDPKFWSSVLPTREDELDEV